MALKDKHIIISGAGGGIGRAIAESCAALGARLALFERDIKLAKAACDGLPATPFAADFAAPEKLAAIVDEAVAKLGRLDGLVNNAAITTPDDGQPIDTPIAQFSQTLAINVTGNFAITRACLPHLITQGGSIVTLSSVVARVGSASAQIAYTTSKGALEAMSREIAIAHARDNIRANCVAPGPIKTARTQHYFDTPEKWQKRRRHIPMGRLGQTKEVAALVAFLLSDAAAYMTGGIYPIDGGISAAYLVDDRDGAATP